MERIFIDSYVVIPSNVCHICERKKRNKTREQIDRKEISALMGPYSFARILKIISYLYDHIFQFLDIISEYTRYDPTIAPWAHARDVRIKNNKKYLMLKNPIEFFTHTQ